MKFNFRKFTNFGLALGLLWLAACDSSTSPSAKPVTENKQNPTSAAPASGTNSEAGKRPEKPRVDLAKTRSLFDKITARQVGAGSGAIEWRDGMGILMHPGSTPTEAVFDVSGTSGAKDLAFWISDLPQNESGNPNCGTAAVEVFLDGVSQGRKKVDQNTNERLAVNLAGVSSMRVVVDDVDGKQFYDWLFLGVD